MHGMSARRTVATAIIALGLGLGVACGTGRDAAGTASFAGATLRIIVGFPPGGGYDLHARLVARHVGRHLPGEPGVVVENMPGAGGGLAANYLGSAAAADGLTIGLLGEASAPDLVASGLLSRVALLGSPGPTSPAVLFTRRSGIATLDDWRRATPAPRIGSSGGRSLSSVVPRLLAASLALPVRQISGYAGTAEVRLALEGGELDAYSFDDGVTRLDQLGEGMLVLRVGPPASPERASLPDALSLAPEGPRHRMLQVGIDEMRVFGRIFVAPRQAPSARLARLRDALAATWSDPRFLADARIAGLSIAPVTADQLDEAATRMQSQPDILDTINAILQQD